MSLIRRKGKGHPFYYLSLGEKLKLIEYAEQNPSLTTSALCTAAQSMFSMECSPTKGSITKLLNQKEYYKSLPPYMYNRKVDVNLRSRFMDRGILLLLMQNNRKNVPSLYTSISSLASNLYEILSPVFGCGLTLSNGWLQTVLRRLNIDSDYRSGKTNMKCFVPFDKYLEDSHKLIVEYGPSNVFILSESSFSSSEWGQSGMKDDLSSSYIRVGLGFNLDGSEKLEPLIVVKEDQLDDSMVQNKVAKGTVMTTLDGKFNLSLFVDWILTLERKFREENRKVLIFVEDNDSHAYLPGLQNVNLKIIPAEFPRSINPANQGIFTLLRMKYAQQQLKYFLSIQELTNSTKSSISEFRTPCFLTASWLVDAWQELSPSTLEDAWNRSSLSLLTYSSKSPKFLSLQYSSDYMDLGSTLSKLWSQLQAHETELSMMKTNDPLEKTTILPSFEELISNWLSESLSKDVHHGELKVNEIVSILFQMFPDVKKLVDEKIEDYDLENSYNPIITTKPRSRRKSLSVDSNNNNIDSEKRNRVEEAVKVNEIVTACGKWLDQSKKVKEIKISKRDIAAAVRDLMLKNERISVEDSSTVLNDAQKLWNAMHQLPMTPAVQKQCDALLALLYAHLKEATK